MAAVKCGTQDGLQPRTVGVSMSGVGGAGTPPAPCASLRRRHQQQAEQEAGVHGGGEDEERTAGWTPHLGQQADETHHPSTSSHPADDTWPCWDAAEPFLLLPKEPRHWLVFVTVYGCIGGLLVFLFVWVFPRVVDAAYDPAVAAFDRALPHAAIGAIVAVAVALLPLTILLPPSPFIWLAAALFDFGKAFAIVMAGCVASYALSFLLVHIWLRPYLLRFLKRYKYTNAVLLGIRKAGPFTTVLIVRLGPVPGPIANYLMAVPDSVPFWIYLAASTLGTTPAISVAVIFGRNIKGLAALLQGKSLPTSQLVVNLVSLGAALLLLLGGYLYARRALAQLHAEADAEAVGAAAAAQQGRGLEQGQGLVQVLVQGAPAVVVTGVPLAHVAMSARAASAPVAPAYMQVAPALPGLLVPYRSVPDEHQAGLTMQDKPPGT